jgi:hypothetical protein
VISGGNNGFFDPSRSKSAIYEKAKWFLENKDKYSALSENAHNTVKK